MDFCSVLGRFMVAYLKALSSSLPISPTSFHHWENRARGLWATLQPGRRAQCCGIEQAAVAWQIQRQRGAMLRKLIQREALGIRHCMKSPLSHGGQRKVVSVISFKRLRSRHVGGEGKFAIADRQLAMHISGS